MKKTIFAAALAVMLLPSVSSAATLHFPSDEPVAEITIPDAWNPKETDSGIEATSDDNSIYLSIDVATAETSDQVIDDVFKFLADNGVTVDPATQKQSEDKINGMTMTNLDWSGKDKDGDVSIGVSLVAPKADKLLVITYWGTKGEQEKNAAALVALITSLKPAN